MASTARHNQPPALIECPHCLGEGDIEFGETDDDGNLLVEECRYCDGTGKVEGDA